MQSNTYIPGLSRNTDLVAKLKEFQENPESLVFVSLSEEYRKQGYPAQALEIVREGQLFHPKLVSAWMCEARILVDLKRFAEALLVTAKILKDSPEHIRAMQLRADIFSRLGQRMAAIKELRKILFLFPDDQNTSAQIIALESVEDESKTDTPLALIGKPEAKGALEGFEVKSIKEIEPVQEELVAHEYVPDAVSDTFATRTIAELYLRQGLNSKALAVLKRILASDPANHWAKEAMRNIQANSSLPDQTNKVVLERQTILSKKAQYLERALTRFQSASGSQRS